MVIIGVLILVAVVQILNRTRNIWLCTGLYSGAAIVFDLVEEYTIMERAIAAAFHIGLAYLLFYLLLRFEDHRAVWWAILIGFISFPILLAFAGV